MLNRLSTPPPTEASGEFQEDSIFEVSSPDDIPGLLATILDRIRTSGQPGQVQLEGQQVRGEDVLTRLVGVTLAFMDGDGSPLPRPDNHAPEMRGKPLLQALVLVDTSVFSLEQILAAFGSTPFRPAIYYLAGETRLWIGQLSNFDPQGRIAVRY